MIPIAAYDGLTSSTGFLTPQGREAAQREWTGNSDLIDHFSRSALRGEIKGADAIDVLFETESLLAFTLDEPIFSHLAWAAGFWDGEGHVGACAQTRTGGRQIKAQITQKDRRVLDQFQSVTGLGSIYPKRAYGWYSWNLARRAQVRELAAMLWPWLGEIKREQFIHAFGVYELLGVRKGGGKR